MFKNYFLLVPMVLFSVGLYAQTVFINEIHYDNAATDENEGVEIAASAGIDLSCYELHLYNGSNSAVYGMESLSGVVENQNDGFGFVWVAIEGLQNGGPDGLALYNKCDDALVQFLSYEGMIAAVDGPASGTISDDIGVEETNTAESNTSLQLTGTGVSYADFVWSDSQTSTNGSINTGQSFGEGVGTDGTSLNVLTSNNTISEDAGEIEISLQAINVTEDFEISIAVTGGSANIDDDFTASNTAINVSAADGANQTLTATITIIDDEEEEESETIEISFATNNETISINKTSITLTIEDNDTPKAGLPAYSIAEVTTENAEGVADSLDVQCTLTGVVQGINLLDEGRLLFTIHDGVAGLSVFNNSTDFEYTVSPGDEITVEGSISQFRGLTQINIEALTVVSSGNELQAFKEVAVLSSSTESENVFLTNLSIVDESQWFGDGSSFNVDFETEDGQTVIVRIDNNTPLANLPFSDFGTADAAFEIYGIGGQFDSESPYDEGYQLFPMKVADVQQVDVSIEEITLNSDIKILQIGNNSFRINALKQAQNIKAFELNGKEVAVISNQQSFSFTTISKGLYLVTFEIDNQIYSAKISIN